MNTTCGKCGLINDFRIIPVNGQDTCRCNGCDHFMGNAPQGGEPTLYVGKFKGRTIKSMILPAEISWLNWYLTTTSCKGKMRSDIENHLKSLNNG